MASRALFTVSAWAGLGLVAASAVLEQTFVVPHGWQELDDLISPSQPLRLAIALRQPDIGGVKDRIRSKAHLSRQEANELRAPDQQDAEDVMAWLAANGIANGKLDQDWIRVRTTVGKAESLLHMQLRHFAFEDQAPILRTREYSIPDSLSEAIRFIHPISNFMVPKNELTARSPPLVERTLGSRNAPCSTGTSPACIREMYNLNYTAPQNTSAIRFGLAGFLEEWANYQDAHRFLQLTAADIASTSYNFSVELVNGGQNLQDPRKAGLEAALDMDYAMALGYPTNITYYSTGGRGTKLGDDGRPMAGELVDNEPYVELLEHLLQKEDSELPHVLSISYADDELSVPRPYAERVCHLFGLLTARGTTVLSGSGDGGARGARNSSCRAHDGSNRDVAMAVFPATCPWVTGVGAVSNMFDPPQGAIYSGGGFSQYFAREDWQDGVVPGYVTALGDHLKPHYNGSMRATPDIAAIGSQFQIVVASQVTRVQGTSASTPVIAAMIALINDARVRQGKRVLGWINELLYSTKVRETLQDVTSGQSQSCKFKDGSTPGGWPAKQGYDAITGLGVPHDFEAFMRALVDA